MSVYVLQLNWTSMMKIGVPEEAYLDAVCVVYVATDLYIYIIIGG